MNFDSSVPSFLPAHRTRFVPCAASGDIAQDEAGGHRLSGGERGTVIQMRLELGGGWEYAVSQPLLNLLHGNAIGQKQAGARVAAVVEANGAQPGGFEAFGEGLRAVGGAEDVAHLV